MTERSEPLLLKVKQVAERMQISVREIWRLVAMGAFPRPLTISPKIKRWPVDVIQQYVEDKKREAGVV